MRVRLQGIVLILVSLVVFGLGVPLALSLADGVRQRLFLDRLTDTARFASLAERPLLDDRFADLDQQMRRYAEVYGVEVAVVDRDLRQVIGTAGDLSADPRVADAIRDALAGRHQGPGERLTPWSTAPLVLTEPVLVDGDVRGAAITISDTSRARTEVLWQWLSLAVGGALAFVLALLLTTPVVRWILRPVHRLDDATEYLVTAVLSGREADPVGESGGPPELRQLARSFDRMAGRVSAALAAQRAFVADASHQLRNPLTALKIRLGNVKSKVEGESATELAAAMVDADRLYRLVDDLLSMAKAEGSGNELVPVVVGDLVDQRVEDWSVVFESRDVVLAAEPTDETMRVLLPPDGLTVVLDSLLDNALKFSEPGTEVKVSVRSAGDRVTIAVRDHGPGLRSEDLDRATDRFWRGARHQNVQGSGLGLAIVREIVTRSDGTLALESPEDGGLLASVTFPAHLP
ncbi:HAMP domain-containing sensor histidine kinase [Amycolatopsis sp. QT-25]|uniref:sensor histidine kinase n=1 Tax=Amycolatopsis sp. QT-25 TaxID=3034022 RepID=UPI0023EDE6F0|nr:HAMP domain-containing sensor histidine kinase [Amycolatopsis sp. QT-25]WET81854.1 HAMP domain-containing sensor histidine kinase [Amycolatopsis sp. QT-25]